jgi:nucleotide-binding universal stress UspA family protein
MYDRILVPTGGSSGTAETLDHALHIATDNDATLHVLYVVDRRLYLAADDETTDDVRESLAADGEAAIEDAKSRAEDADVAVETVLREGVPHKEIVSYAEDSEIDLLAMGTHGRTGRDRLASLGSVTDRVVETADRPVLVVNIADD